MVALLEPQVPLTITRQPPSHPLCDLSAFVCVSGLLYIRSYGQTLRVPVIRVHGVGFVWGLRCARADNRALAFPVYDFSGNLPVFW